MTHARVSRRLALSCPIPSGRDLGYNTRCRSECALIAHQRGASWGAQPPATRSMSQPPAWQP